MKFVLLISILLFGHIAAIPQVAKASKIEQVQTVVGSLVSKSGKAEFLISDFQVIEGSVVALEEDSFSLKIKGVDGKKRTGEVSYEDVLVISGKNVAVSFIPDPDLRPFGKWEDILKIDYNHNLEVILENGEIVSGRLNEKTKDKIILIGKTLDAKHSLPRNKISSVYRVWREYDSALEGTASGAKKGKNIGEVIGLGSPYTAAFGAAIGAIIGTSVGASRKESKLRILIYSK